MRDMLWLEGEEIVLEMVNSVKHMANWLWVMPQLCRGYILGCQVNSKDSSASEWPAMNQALSAMDERKMISEDWGRRPVGEYHHPGPGIPIRTGTGYSSKLGTCSFDGFTRCGRQCSGSFRRASYQGHMSKL